MFGVEAKTGKFLWRYDKTSGQRAEHPDARRRRGTRLQRQRPLGGAAVRLMADGGPSRPSRSTAAEAAPNDRRRGARRRVPLRHQRADARVRRVRDRQVKWAERSVAPGAVCYADGRLYLHGEGGDVALVEATPEAYRENGRFTPPDPPKQRANRREKAWAYPVIANGRLYIRDADACGATTSSPRRPGSNQPADDREGRFDSFDGPARITAPPRPHSNFCLSIGSVATESANLDRVALGSVNHRDRQTDGVAVCPRNQRKYLRATSPP